MSGAMSRLPLQQPISVHDYLAGETLATRKHEYVAGRVYAMAGGTIGHNRIATNATVAIGGQLSGRPCEVFNSDMKVRVRQRNSVRFYYPDASVICDPNPSNLTYQNRPVVIVEVISESTRRVDEYEKYEAYLSIDSLCVYVLVEANKAATVIYRRDDEGFNRELYVGHDAIVTLPEINCHLALSDLYSKVVFEPIVEDES